MWRAAGSGGGANRDGSIPRGSTSSTRTRVKTNMTRTHERCLRGARLIGKVPHGQWRTLTFLGDEKELMARTPATEDLRTQHAGMGRELFAGFRALVGAADRGASVFG